MLNKEQIFFLSMLADYANGRKTVSADVDLNKVQQIAKRQQLETLFFYQCWELFENPEEKESALSKLRAALFLSTTRASYIQKIVEAFTKENVVCSLVKGHELEKLYEPNYVRTMSDTDIMIHSADRQQVDRILQELNFVCHHDVGDEWHYRKKHIFIEVHTSMVHAHKGNEKNVQYFNDLWNYGKVENGYHKLDWNFHFCYLIQHISGHFVMTGIGFRQFLDLAVVVQKVHLDWSVIERELTKLGLWEFALTCMAFCYRWFDVKFPVMREFVDDDLFMASTEKMFSDGVFGHDNAQNKDVSRMVEKGYYGGKSMHLSKLAIKCGVIFPRYASLKDEHYCSFLKGRPYLLPVAWIWRFIYKIFVGKRMKNGIQALNVSSEDAQVRQRLSYLKQWGL